MKGKIFRWTFVVSIVVFLSSFVLIMGALHSYSIGVQESQLNGALGLAATAVNNEGIDYLKKLKKDDQRLTLVSSDGKVLYDTWGDASKFENHRNRKEIRDALIHGEGESGRYSKTFTEKMLYHAVKLDSGDVLRISTSRATYLTLVLGMLQSICFIIAGAILLSAFLSAKLSKQIGREIEGLLNPEESETM